jgi:hypothetical protein
MAEVLVSNLVDQSGRLLPGAWLIVYLLGAEGPDATSRIAALTGIITVPDVSHVTDSKCWSEAKRILIIGQSLNY